DGRRRGTGQVWVRTRRLAQRQRNLLGGGRLPAEAAELLSDRLLGDADALGDRAQALAVGAQPMDQPRPSAVEARPALRVPVHPSERGQPALLETPLVSTHASRRAA